MNSFFNLEYSSPLNILKLFKNVLFELDVDDPPLFEKAEKLPLLLYMKEFFEELVVGVVDEVKVEGICGICKDIGGASGFSSDNLVNSCLSM